MLKLERKVLLEVPTELSGLLEPVSDPEARLRLLSNNALVLQCIFSSIVVLVVLCLTVVSNAVILCTNLIVKTTASNESQ